MQRAPRLAYCARCKLREGEIAENKKMKMKMTGKMHKRRSSAEGHVLRKKRKQVLEGGGEGACACARARACLCVAEEEESTAERRR